MRKTSLLVVAIVACFLTVATTASANRYAAPVAEAGADPDVCDINARCSIEDALDPAKVVADDRIILGPGIYSVSTALSVTDADVVLKTDGNASDTIINSTYMGDFALTLDNAAEASRFTLNASSSGAGLNIVEGIVDHLNVASANSHGCTGKDARVIESICESTYDVANSAGFFADVFGSLDLTFRNSTLIGGTMSRGLDLLADGTDETLQVDILSTIIHGFIPSAFTANGGAVLNPTVEYSNFPEITLTDSGGETTLSPTGTNQGAAPLFVDLEESNWRQAPGSPTINAGAVDGLSDDIDLDGNPREVGGQADIGAFESSAVPVTLPGPPPAAVIIPKDTTKPTVTISKKPKSKTTSRKLRVVFKADEAATFECKLDKGKFKPCKSPYKKTVNVGKHKLQIKATDAAGNVSSVKTIKWTVKKKN